MTSNIVVLPLSSRSHRLEHLKRDEDHLPRAVIGKDEVAPAAAPRAHLGLVGPGMMGVLGRVPVLIGVGVGAVGRRSVFIRAQGVAGCACDA